MGHAGTHPAPACLGPPTELGSWQATGFLLKDQLCLKAFQPTHTVSCFFRFRYNCSPFYIYTYTKHAHIKQIVSSLHLFSIYSSRDHFIIIHVKKRTLFQTPDPCCQSLGYWGSPAVARSPCMLSVVQTGYLALCSCGPRLLSHIKSLRTLWNLNCTCISHFLRIMINTISVSKL